MRKRDARFPCVVNSLGSIPIAPYPRQIGTPRRCGQNCKGHTEICQSHAYIIVLIISWPPSHTQMSTFKNFIPHSFVSRRVKEHQQKKKQHQNKIQDDIPIPNFAGSRTTKKVPKEYNSRHERHFGLPPFPINAQDDCHAPRSAA